MKKYVFKRLCIAVVTVFVILFVLFLMLELMPGSPFNDEKMTETQKMMLNQKYGLDKPVMVRFFNYIKNMLTGDFGVSYSIQKNMPVADMLGPRLLISLRLGLQAAAVGSVIGLVLGIVAALKRNTWFDTLATIVSVLGISLPSFVFALGLSYFLGFKIKMFPLIYSTAEPGLSSVLPTISLCMFTVASIARYARSEMVEVLTSDYIQLADAHHPARAAQHTHRHHYCAGAACGEPDDRLACGGKGIFHPRYRKLFYYGYPEQRLQCHPWHQLYLQRDVHWRDAACGYSVRRDRPAHPPCEGGMTKWKKNAPSQRRISAL